MNSSACLEKPKALKTCKNTLENPCSTSTFLMHPAPGSRGPWFLLNHPEVEKSCQAGPLLQIHQSISILFALKMKKNDTKKIPTPKRATTKNLETPQFYYSSFTHFFGRSWWPLKKKGRRKRTPQLLCWRRVSRGLLTWTFSLRESPQRFRSRVGAGDISTQLWSSVKYTHMNIHNNKKKHIRNVTWPLQGECQPKKLSDLQKLWGVRRFFLALRFFSPMWFCILKHLHY